MSDRSRVLSLLLFLLSFPLLAQTQPPRTQISRAWIPADPTVLCVEAQDKALCAELLEIRDRDQIVRRKWMENRSDPALQAEVNEVDRLNLVRIEEIIGERGYPGKTLVGLKAGGAAWTVIQHSDLETQKRYLDVMTRAAEAGELDFALVATTIDRIRVNEKKPQIYGTQFKEVNGEMVPEPIEDETHVDERRAKAGLGTLAEYKDMMKQMYQPRTLVKKE